MKGLFFAVGCAVFSASFAFAFEATDCHFLEEWDHARRFVECSVENNGTVPIADLSYTVLVTETDRTVPWGETEVRTVYVDGGIEPGEVVSLMFAGPGIPSRAKGVLTIAVTITEARDVSGSSID